MTTPCSPRFVLPPCQRRVDLVCLTVPASAEIIQALRVWRCNSDDTYQTPVFYALDGTTPIADGGTRLIECPRQVFSSAGVSLSSARRVLYEVSGLYSYYGHAAITAGPGDGVWTIVRSFNNAGTEVLTTATGVSWTGRVTHTYT